MIKKITVVCENSIYFPFPLIGEHGLSFLLEGDDNTLFDTGQGLGVIHNLKVLGKKISSIKRIILSHGHYDHTGGLMQVLTEHAGGLPVYLHSSAFNEKVSMLPSGVTIPIGMKSKREDYEDAGARFVEVGRYSRITGSLFTLSEVKRPEWWEPWDVMLKEKSSGGFRSDRFDDDLSLLVETPSGPVVVLGCAHAGIVEILDQMSEASGYREFHAVIGGTHLVNAPDEYVRRSMEAMNRFRVEVIAVSHCTGFKVASVFAAEFGGRFVNASAGRVFDF